MIDGCRESEVSLRVVKRRYVFGFGWLNARPKPEAGGMQRGRAAGHLAKMFCTTKHILQCAYGLKLPLYYEGFIVLQ